MKFIAKNSFILTLILVVALHFVLDKGLGIDNSWIRLGIVFIILLFIMPRKKKIQTQSGEKTQITWFFLKKPIILD
ncbi:hypothetical protein H0I31_05880 [Tenacibaculum sp. AHE15PA]|uniref:hypothetical protein n=1 Tax=Tenacibaculum TaxID=104267 RepID=UPI001C4F2D55|nr:MULTISPECIES: hypothetical protein [Tenacibaculum]QXP73223.1 hypothetical protein H0I30_11140 [Tenacibaculum sp. AHE14PA]QXP77136.1 hypothetical protein H0I31_05880 [Tenacibaculum sp. AHE15PA]